MIKYFGDDPDMVSDMANNYSLTIGFVIMFGKITLRFGIRETHSLVISMKVGEICRSYRSKQKII